VQGNTTIASGATQRVEAFTDVDVNLSGKAAAVLGGPAEAAALANGHDTPQVPHMLLDPLAPKLPFWLHPSVAQLLMALCSFAL
jgi:hypothetical protein